MNNKLNKITIAILLAQGVAMTATAADKVKISSVVSAGGGGYSANTDSNIWFTLDDSGSMGSMGTGVYDKINLVAGKKCKTRYVEKCIIPKPYGCRQYRWVREEYDCKKTTKTFYNKGVTGRLVFGYVPYEPDITYQVPVDYQGNKLPLPNEVDKTYKLGPYQGQTVNTATAGTSTDKDSLYSDIFITYARDKLGFTASNQADPDKGDYAGYAGKTWSKVENHPTIAITDTAKVLEESYNNKSYYSKVADDDSCTNAADKKNCQKWKTYYSTRMLALKSSLSLTLYKHRDVNYRFGYQSLWHQGVNLPFDKRFEDFKKFESAKNGSSRWGIWGGRKERMNERVSLFPLKTNNEANRKELYKWLYTLIPESGTPSRGVVSHLFYELKKPEHGGSPTGSIYRKDPTKPHDETDNSAITCRKNHNIIFTDGQWETYNQHATEYAVKKKMEKYTQQYGENNFSLPDGKTYSAKSRFKASPLIGGTGVIGFADMAFQAWATDLDANPNNNIKSEDGALVVQNKEHPDTDGKPMVYTDGDANSHHFNDPATWQHVNTHAIGFGLDESHYGAIHINPPETKEEANNLTDTFDWKRSTTSDLTWQDYKKSYKMPVKLAQGDLARAAIAGRGLYANAKSGQDLIKIFDRIMLSLKDDTEPVAATTGSAGVAGSSQTAGNSYFASRYDGKAFTGELIKFNLFSGNPDDATACFGTAPNPLPKAGTACTVPAKSGGSDWNVAKLLTAKNWTDRKLITAKRENGKNDHEVVDFKPDDIHDDQKKTLKDNFTTAISGNFSDDDQRLQALFDYVQGDGTHEDKFRSRNNHEYSETDKGRNILGAIMRSSPVYIGVPNAYTAHLSKDSDAYKNYINLLQKYIENNKDGKKEVVFVGANDGMLHAFNANTGQEVFAYVPAAVYEKLPQTVDSGRKVSLVDGNIDVQLVNFGSDTDDDSENADWERVLVGGMGGGAKGLYSLNITAPINSSGTPTATTVKNANKGNWEVSAKQSDNVGNILAKPAIIQLADNTWAAVVGNGYNSKNNKAVLLVINLENGEIIQQLEMPEKKGSTTFSDSSKPNGLGPLRFVRYPNKDKSKSNHYDRAYAGDLQGNLWVFDLTNSSKSGGITVVNKQPLFTATDKDGKRQPITVAPLAVKHPWGYGTLIHFGTGALFAVNDLSTKVTNSIYAIWDDWIPKDNGGLPREKERNTTVERSELNDVKMKTTTVVKKEVRYLDTAKNNNTVWRLKDTPSKDENGNEITTYRGWKIDLEKGERAWQSATMLYGSGNAEAIGYNLVKYVGSTTESACGGSTGTVQNIEMAFNPDDAAQLLPSSGALDINDDGSLSDTDKVTVTVDGKEKTIPATGQVTLGEIKYNATNQNIKKGGGGTTGGGTTAQRNTCRFNRSTTVSSKGGTPSGVTIERCSYFSSWKELK